MRQPILICQHHQLEKLLLSPPRIGTSMAQNRPDLKTRPDKRIIFLLRLHLEWL